ncbi:MAG: hypothetical protein KH231_07705 [Dialister sp.]|uniref:hypothetical protein n=1 Tax=Dialister sp. TaxID=1955814 RepID=UPI001D92E39C|nr:hypothetical protein [Dialister sp.]MBS6715333.1 hypothetical protein [Dialister sp.]
MKFENTEVFGVKSAVRGMRNPLSSWDKSDSVYDEETETLIIGKNDAELAKKLVNAGTEHRKFLRQIFVSVDITAPLYFWKEFDTYKVGVTSNSTSTMHTISKNPITIDCFETDDFQRNLLVSSITADSWALDNTGVERIERSIVEKIIPFLEGLRRKYLETNDKRYWKELIRWLPESWLQKRTITMNYENVANICKQRRNHKLNEWSGQDNPECDNFIAWAETLPCVKEFGIV